MGITLVVGGTFLDIDIMYPQMYPQTYLDVNGDYRTAPNDKFGFYTNKNLFFGQYRTVLFKNMEAGVGFEPA